METPGKAFYNRQVEFLEARDVVGLVTTQYTPDAELVSFDYSLKGRQALLEHFSRYLERLGEFQRLSTDKFIETEDALFFEATIRVNGGRARVYNAFVLKEGKATHHFTGLIGFTPD
ncbi:MAG: nuclear transport factor 2 family protein [Anaerolineales bacterium]|nr:nuclear transport factor 2 family protein [Anaerolineales bacterium]